MIHNIGLAGGGFYGIAHVAVLKEMEKYSDKIDLKCISGVSVCSIVAALYAVGYNADELTYILKDTDLDGLLQKGGRSYYNLFSKLGMYHGGYLEEEIERLIRIKTNIRFCSFNQIPIKLEIISTNLNRQCSHVFSRDTSPYFPISKAVRMSIGYPLIIEPVLYQGDLFGDGGEFINYPITHFTDLSSTIGITFAAHNENIDGTLQERISIGGIYDYICSIATTLARSCYISQISSIHLARSVVVPIDQPITSMQFGLTQIQKDAIYQCGINAAKIRLPEILNN